MKENILLEILLCDFVRCLEEVISSCKRYIVYCMKRKYLDILCDFYRQNCFREFGVVFSALCRKIQFLVIKLLNACIVYEIVRCLIH